MRAHFFGQRQRGATLLISLVMLVILTLFAVSGFNLSSVNLKIAGNFQAQRLMEATAMEQLEKAISTAALFTTPAASQLCVGGGSLPTCAGGYKVDITAAKCNYSAPATGFSLKEGTLAPDENDWELTASATDTLTGAKAAVGQGVRMRMLAGNCK